MRDNDRTRRKHDAEHPSRHVAVDRTNDRARLERLRRTIADERSARESRRDRPPAAGTTSPSAGSSESPIPTESPIPVESNPPGDIPDNAAFVPFTSKAGGFVISTPEGWARTTSGSSVTFTDKLNTVVVSWEHASSVPTVASVKKTEVHALESTERAFKLGSITTASLPAGPAIMIDTRRTASRTP